MFADKDITAMIPAIELHGLVVGIKTCDLSQVKSPWRHVACGSPTILEIRISVHMQRTTHLMYSTHPSRGTNYVCKERCESQARTTTRTRPTRQLDGNTVRMSMGAHQH